MKLLRHFAAVVLVVAVIVGLGMLWAHVSGGGTGAGGGLRRLPSGDALQRLNQVKAGVAAIGPDTGFHLGDTRDVISTCMIEAVLAAIVIMVSVVRRRDRRTRNTPLSGA